MTAHFDGVQAWWAGRSRREQWLLAAMVAALAIAAAWYGVAIPLADWAHNADDRRKDAARQMTEVRRNVAQIKAVQQSRTTSSPVSLAEVIDQTSAAAGVTLARRQAEANGGYTVWIEGGASNSAFAWISDLQQRHGVNVSNLTALKADRVGGGLDVQVSFRAAAP